MVFRIERRLGTHGKGPGLNYYIRIGDGGSGPPPTDPPVNTALPEITGTPTVGQVLSLSNGTWDNSPTSFAYSWYKDGALLVGYTDATYTALFEDATHDIVGRVTASNIHGSAYAESDPVEIAGVAPVNTVLPTFAGNAKAGQTLTAVNGTWNYSPSSFTRSWLVDGVSKGTGSTYLVEDADIGKTLVLRITATNAFGSTPADAVGVSVTGNPPVNTVAPSITGDIKVGGEATLNLGTWTGGGTPDFIWLLDGFPIVGETDNPLDLTGYTDGSVLSASVTYTNAWGATSANAAGVEIQPDTLVPELAFVSMQTVATPSGTVFSTTVGSLGPDDPNRLVVVYAGALDVGSNSTTTAVTVKINGVTASVAACSSRNINTGKTVMACIAWAIVPTGTTATVEVTLPRTPNPAFVGLGLAHWVGKVNSPTPKFNTSATGTIALQTLTPTGTDADDVGIWGGASGDSMDLASQTNSTNEGRAVGLNRRFTYFGRIIDPTAPMSTTGTADEHRTRLIVWG